MPQYPFRKPDGEVVDLFFSMADVPSIGETIDHEGEEHTRLASTNLHAQDGFQPFMSRQLQPFDERAPRHDKDGNAVFNSKREVREFTAKTKGTGDHPTVDAQWHYD